MSVSALGCAISRSFVLVLAASAIAASGAPAARAQTAPPSPSLSAPSPDPSLPRSLPAPVQAAALQAQSPPVALPATSPSVPSSSGSLLSESRIVSFELLNIRPQPIILGSTALGEISIEVEYGAASDVRGDITDLIHRLQVAVDTRRLVRAEISIARMDLPHSEAANLTRGKILGQVAFTLAVGDVGSTFLGVKWGGNHLINLVDPKSGFKSSFIAVEIQSGRLVRWGMVSGGIVLAFLLGVGAWWTDVLRRVLLRMKRRLPPPVGQAEVTSMNSKAPDPTIDASDDHRPPVLPPEVPGALLTALSESRAVLVLGEGASAQAGFPTGPVFLDRLLERLRGELPEGMVRVLTANDGDGSRRLASRVGGFSKIMDAIVSSVPRDRIVREIQDILTKVYPDPDFHEMLAGLPWCGVVSLSWDGFDESRFTKERSSTNGE